MAQPSFRGARSANPEPRDDFAQDNIEIPDLALMGPPGMTFWELPARNDEYVACLASPK